MCADRDHPQDLFKTPLKRHPVLQPLSREHMSGLIQARNLQQSADGDDEARRRSIDEFMAVWRGEIREHFDDEERLLLPLTNCHSLRERLLAEHAALRELAEQCVGDPKAFASDIKKVRTLGVLLQEHIRWEERVYFEAVQREHPEELALLVPESEAIEHRRPGARARHRLNPPYTNGERDRHLQ